MKKLQPLVHGLISIGTLVALWELSAKMGWEYSTIFPPPSQFIGEIAADKFQIGIASQATSIPASIGSSILRVVMGLVMGFIAALLCGFLMTTNRWVKSFFMPLVQLLAPIAPIAWIPLALVLFGIGNSTAIFIVFMGVFFMLTIATVKAIENVPENLIFSALTLGATKKTLWFRVILPSILPHVFTILRLNFIAAWMAVLAAEMTGLRDGLGAVIMMGRNLFNNELILFGMLLIGITGFVFDQSLKYIQTRFFWWDKLKSYTTHRYNWQQ